MGYEDAPATKMVATRCAICHKDLVDALSVEVGVGPVCRKRHLTELYDLDDDDPSRQQANKIIYAIACNQHGDNLDSLKALFALGFPKAVKAICRTIAKVKIEYDQDTDTYAIKTPYCPEATNAWRGVAGRRWDKEKKVNRIPASSKGQVFSLLAQYHAGETAIGPKGPFVVRGREDEAPVQKFQKVCSWCKKVMDPGDPGAPVSHGICPECDARLEAEAQVEDANLAGGLIQKEGE